MNKLLVSILGAGVLLLSTSAASATDFQSRHSAPGTERKTVGRRLGEEPAKNTYFAPVRTVATAQQSSFVTKALSFKLPTKAPAKAPVSRSSANLPKLQGNVTYSDAWTPTTYPTVGVYTVPTSADGTFEMLIDSPNGNRGGVVKDGIYFCHTYENFMGMFNYYDIFGYDMTSGTKVFEFNGPNVGCMTQGLAVDLPTTPSTAFSTVKMAKVSVWRPSTIKLPKTMSLSLPLPTSKVAGTPLLAAAKASSMAYRSTRMPQPTK